MFLLQWIPCHRRNDRTIKIASYKFPLCARCTGIIIGYFFLPLLILNSSPLKWWFIPLLLLPLLIDGFTQKWGFRDSNNLLRVITGVLFGIGQCIFIVISVRFLLKIIT